MITGSLQIKKNIYYAVLNLTDENGNRKQKWISTGYSTTGHNKRAATNVLNELIDKYGHMPKSLHVPTGVLFVDYAEAWLRAAEFIYDPITFQGYKSAVEAHVLPYFRKTGLKLVEVTPDVVQEFSTYLSREGNLKTGGALSGKSVRNYLTVLSQIFEDACSKKKIPENPTRLVKKPKKKKFRPSFYTSEQMKLLFDAVKNEPIAPLIKIAAVYGMRRSELLGLKWDSVDFINKQVTVQHVVSRFTTTVEKNDTKTEESRRVYPMTPQIEKIFLEEKLREELNRKTFGDRYIKNDYVFKWDNGKMYDPNYLTRKFRRILQKNDLPVIRFHDLRHSCASILLESGHNLKDVQQWLGHADIQTTGNIYGHLTNDHLKTVGDDMCKELF